MSIGALSLTRIRELLRGAVWLRQSQGDGFLQLLDGLELFGPDDVVDLSDGLHPNADWPPSDGPTVPATHAIERTV